MNSPVVDKDFFIKYLQNVKYSEELDKVQEKEKVTGITPSGVEIKLEKGQWPQGWYGWFPNELFAVNMSTIEYIKFLEMVQKIDPIYRARINYNMTKLKPTSEDLTKIYKPAFKKSKIDLKC